MSASEKIRTLSAWIDNSYPEDMIGTELHARRRIDKLMEEVLRTMHAYEDEATPSRAVSETTSGTRLTL